MTFFTYTLVWLAQQSSITPTVSALGMFSGAFVSRAIGFSALTGISVGGFLISFARISIPVPIEAVVIGALGASFFLSITTKQILRGYYYFRYGRSNADGYDFNHSQDFTVITENDVKQAAILQVAPQAVTDLRVNCLNALDRVKEVSHVGHSFTGTRWQLSNSFKDILHLLMRAQNNEDKEKLEDLLFETQQTLNQAKAVDTVGMFNSIYCMINQPEAMEKYATLSTSVKPINSSVFSRTLFHKQGIEAAIAKQDQRGNSAFKANLTLSIRPFLL